MSVQQLCILCVAAVLLFGCGVTGQTHGGNTTASGAGGPFQTHGRGITNAENVNINQPFGCPVDPASLGMMEPVHWPYERLADQWGGTALRYSDVPTSKAVPAERCGAHDSYEYLTMLTCDNGSRPFSHLEQAQAARVGSMGSGGSCGFIVDLYQVRCPEKSYEVYIDMYHCPEGQSVI
ncbi:MAG: hypothetical protein JXX29_20175 [Deltaproteobacteria bacterium]|nr:hypothetical protein [Deltaproteobacteria bacterium]MBN2674010.1 hypothetical protein [Deltaproteobacteria bacterium]